jgi:hypothetical protein
MVAIKQYFGTVCTVSTFGTFQFTNKYFTHGTRRERITLFMLLQYCCDARTVLQYRCDALTVYTIVLLPTFCCDIAV